MKAVKTAVILLLCSLAFVITNSILLTEIINGVLTEIDAAGDDITTAEESYSKIYDGLKDKLSYVSLTVNHEDLSSITDEFAELVGSARANDEEGFLAVKSRLISSLEHLKRLVGINIDSIL